MPNLISRSTAQQASQSTTMMLSAALLVGLCAMTSTGCSTQKVKKGLGPEKTEQAYYESSQRALRGQQFESAARDLKALETFYPVGVYTEQSQLDLMYSYYRQSSYSEAITTAEHFIRLYPNNAQVDYAHYLRGVSNMMIGSSSIMHLFKQQSAERDLSQARLAFDNFKTLVTTYPNSQYTPDALLRMQYIRNQMAENELAVAHFYVKREAYLAAIARATTVVQFFPSSPQVPDALEVLVTCYTKTGNDALSKQYLEVIRLNYPERLNNGTLKSTQNTSSLGEVMKGISSKFATLVQPKPLVK